MARLRALFACALPLVLVTASHSPADSLLARVRGPRVAVHRGGFGLPDQNTVARFEVARGQGADIVETDLRASKDGVVFLFHNSRLDKVTSCAGEFSSHTAAEIARCHLNGLERGPDRFEDALRWSRGRVVIDAEFKSADVVKPAIDLVRKHRAVDWVYFQVGNGLRIYRAAREYDSRVALEASPRGARAEHWLAELLAKEDSRLLLIQLHPDFLSSDLLQRIHASGKVTSLNAWQLTPEENGATCARVFELGIDVAVTNAPEPCVKQRDEARALRTDSKPIAAQ